MEDERLRERLLLRAARMEGLDLAAFYRATDDAVDFEESPEYGPPWDYARGIENVVASIAELLEESFASEVVGLSEYAPGESLEVYLNRIEPLVQRTNNKAYQEAYALLLRSRELTKRLGREPEFAEYLEILRLEYKRKRNFVKLLDGME